MKRNARIGLWASLVGLLMVGEGVAASSWLDGYAFRRKLSVTNLTVVGSDQTNFPILVKFTPSNFSFQNSNTNGYDVRFTAADGTTLLSFEREKHVALAGEAAYWVKLPILSSGASTDFYVYYRMQAAADGASPTNVWDSNYLFVFHMNEASGAVHDSTANGREYGLGSVTLGPYGLIDGGTTGSSMTTWVSPSITRPIAMTYEILFNTPTTGAGGYQLLFQALWSGHDSSYYFYLNSNSNLFSFVNDGSGHSYSTATSLSLNQWHYAVDIYGDSAPGRKMYVDGLLDGSLDHNGIPLAAYFDPAQYVLQGFNGAVDEVRLSNIARSAAWIQAQNASMRDQLLSYGTEATRPTWLSGYQYRQKLVATNAAAIVTNLFNFPVLVKFSSANFNFGRAAADGRDLCFTAADGVTPLAFEREQHDGGGGQAVYWVKLPWLSSVAPTAFYVYYKSADAVDSANPTNVWDSNYMFVFHMKDTSSPIHDSTANAWSVGGVPLTPSGFIAGGAAYGTVSQNCYFSPLNTMARPSAMTFEAWVNLPLGADDGAGRYQAPFFSVLNGVQAAYYTRLDSTTNLVSIVNYATDGGLAVTGTTPLSLNTWHYLADIYGDSAPGRKIYLDGLLDGSADDNRIPYAPCFTPQQNLAYGFLGALDEVRMSSVARSAAWLQAQNTSMRNELLSYGSEEHGPSGTLIYCN